MAEKVPATYRELVEEQRLTPDATWMIGNSPRSDILAARAAGLRAVFIPHPYTWSLEEQEIDPADRGVLHLARFPEPVEPLLKPARQTVGRARRRCGLGLPRGRGRAGRRPQAPAAHRRCAARHPDRAGALAATDARPAVPVALLVAGAPAGLPVDAQLRDPRPRRAATIATLTRSVRLRNGGRWTNPFYDDVAWLGLAVQRAGTLARDNRVLGAVIRQLHRGWTEDGGGGIWWRRGGGADGRVKNVPANGPAAILLAREGQIEFAAAITDWMAETLVDPDTGLVCDGVRLAAGRLRLRGRPPHLHLLPGRAPRRVRRARRPRRPPALGRPRGRARRRRDPPPRPLRRRAARLRRGRRRALRGHPRALPRGGGAAQAGAHRRRRPHRAGQRRRRVARQAGRALRAGVLRRVEPPGPHAAPGRRRRPTSRCSSPPGWCSKRRPGCRAPRRRGRPCCRGGPAAARR